MSPRHVPHLKKKRRKDATENAECHRRGLRFLWLVAEVVAKSFRLWQPSCRIAGQRGATQVHINTKMRLLKITMHIEVPKLYRGKALKGTFNDQECKNLIVSPPTKFHDGWQAYVEWATEEFVDGRPWGPLKMSSARQVVGSAQRFSSWLQEYKPLFPCTIIVSSLTWGEVNNIF